MENNNYLIPANTKKGLLIFNVFTPFDLILFGTGIGISLLLLVIIGTDDLLTTALVLSPGLVCSFLVLPIPNYHNVITFIKSMFSFLTGQRIFMWKGWCFYESTSEDK